MPRVAGVDIQANKKVLYALPYIYGIGRTMEAKILKDASVDENMRAKNLTDEQIGKINAIIDKGYPVEGILKRMVAENVKRLKDIGSYRGMRHRRGLPVRGQRTRTNARTRKGPRKTVAGKKEAKQQG